MQKPCEETVLARGCGSEVRYCTDCRVFHIGIGPLTVRLEAPVAQDLRDTVCRAFEAYEEAVAERAGAPPRRAVVAH